MKTSEKILAFAGLQFFADAGTVVNATANITNAYTGDQTPRTEANKMSDTLKAFYDTKLLENSRVEMVYSQFAMKQPMPKGRNGVVEWRKPNKFALATELVEGVIPSGQEFGMTSLTGHVTQYGTYTTVSDKLELFAYDPIIDMMTKEMAASAAQTDEKLTRDSLLTNANVMYCDNVTKDGKTYKSTPTTPATMGCSDTDGYSMLTSRMISKAVAFFRKNNVPKINGHYYCVVNPSVAFDLRNDEGWLEAHKYVDNTPILNGEIGMLHGVRFVEDSYAPILKGDYKNKSNGATYACYMFGADAFGKIEAAGGNLQMIVKDKSDVGGPLDQFSTIGYKFMTNGGTILYPERLLRIMACSTEFSATDAEN